MRRIIRIVLGTTFVLLSLPSFLFPILPGWVLLALGILLLSVDIPLVHRLVRRLEDRFPQARSAVARVRRFLGVPEDRS
jgi:hypothetical protein